MGDGDKAGLRQMMPSVFNGIATAIAAAAGLIGVLHQTGYLGNHPRVRAGIEARALAHPRTLDPGPLAAVDAPAAADLPASGGDSHAVVAAAPMHRNLSGAWRDMASNCHLIKQTGHELIVSSYAADTGRLRSVGSGTVKGRAISVRLNSANPASAEVDLILSDDGRELSGMIKGANGAHVSKWRLVGPSCVQTASRPD
ncbi:MAG TPA: hypothetical protein VIW95_08820 [Candidatus Binatus sp.]|jgi:hypothetical protein|uniref:hypothetical protein n=1 Tax=Candidatus Binatus sp. TaxID=2811406 RepID=UPI002F42DC6D